MSNSLYGFSQSNNSYTVLLPDGTLFPVISGYSEAQSKAVIVRGCFFSDSHSQSYLPRHLSLRLAFPWLLQSDCWLRLPCVLTWGPYLPRPIMIVFEDVCVQYAHGQKPKHVRADASCFLFCLATPQWHSSRRVSVFTHSHCISSLFRSHKFNHELGVGARRGRRIWLVMYSTRWAWWINYLVLANALSRCPQAHVGCRYRSLVSLLGRVRKFFDRFILGLW